MDKIIGLAGTALLYLCTATLLAQLIFVGYVVAAWKIDRTRLVQMIAIARGIDLFAVAESVVEETATEPEEQVSLKAVAEKRAEEFRFLEEREEALRKALDQLAFERQRLGDEQIKFKRRQEQFDEALVEMETGARAAGMEQNMQILQNIQPAQAKDLLYDMISAGEINDVVRLLRDMSDSKRKRIVGEFETLEEQEKIGEVLRLIREGVPETTLAEDARGDAAMGAGN